MSWAVRKGEDDWRYESRDGGSDGVGGEILGGRGERQDAGWERESATTSTPVACTCKCNVQRESERTTQEKQEVSIQSE